MRGFLFINFLNLILLHFVHCDYFSAINDLEHLLDAEAYIAENLARYIENVEYGNEKIEKFLAHINATVIPINDEDVDDFYGDPINAFKTISRLVTHWKANVFDHVFSTNNFDNYKNNLTLLGSLSEPTKEDISGATKGIERLQNTYSLSTADVANGIFYNQKVADSLSASDCYQIGLNLYEMKNYQLAIEWLLAARTRYRHDINAQKYPESFPRLDYKQLLLHLSIAFYYNGNSKLAEIINSDLLLIDPQHEHALTNKLIYYNKIIKDPNENAIENKPEETDSTIFNSAATMDLYKKVCRKEVVRTPREQRTLRCQFTHKNIPYRFIQPFKMEKLNHDPFVAYYHDAIYETEIQNIIEVAKGKAHRSEVGHQNSSIVSDIRISKNAWLYYEQHSFLSNIKQRLEDITGLSAKTAEPLQVANYGIGGHYEPHCDFSETPEKAYPNIGNRILTALFYINDVKLGGATAFPFLRLAVPPIRGSLLVWYNLHSSLEKDYRTKHAACPVLQGSKWICNEWFHEVGQEFLRPCGLTPKGIDSIKYEDI